jgi:hypothetical protein
LTKNISWMMNSRCFFVLEVYRIIYVIWEEILFWYYSTNLVVQYISDLSFRIIVNRWYIVLDMVHSNFVWLCFLIVTF